MEIDEILDEAFERLKLVKVDDTEIMLYKFILLAFVLGCVNNFTTDWKRSIHNFYEHKAHNISEAKKANTIKNVWRKYNLAKEGKDVEEFFKFLKSEAIKYDLQKCVKIYDTMSKVNEAIKKLSNLTTNSDNNVVKILCNWIQFSDLQKDDVILSGVFDTRKISRSLKAHLELRDVWHLINEDIVVRDIPIEFEKHIERVVLDDDDRILDEYYNNSSNRNFMKEEFRSLNNIIYKIKNLWENPTYKTDDSIIESTWNQDFVGPAIDYILHGIKIYRNWCLFTYNYSPFCISVYHFIVFFRRDNRRIESTLNIQCKPKKGDFRGYMRSLANKSYNYEIIFGETSYGPNHPNNSDHIYDDQVRLAKFSKTSFESIYNIFHGQDHKRLEDINLFIIQSHGYFLTLSIMDCKFLPFCRIRSLESLHIPLEAGPNSLEYIKKIIKVLYNYHILVKETVKKIDNIDVELATLLESVTQSDRIQAEIPIYETP